MTELIELAKTFGPWVALCIYFVWQSSIRESRYAKSIEALNTYIQGELASTIRANTAAMQAIQNSITKCQERS